MTTSLAPCLNVAALPVPPSLNHAYRNVRGVGRVLTTEARSYKQTATLLIRNAAALQGFSLPPKTPLRLTFWFWFERNNRDGSNAVKLIEDAAAEALGFDDRYVVAMQWTKAIDKAAPRAAIRVEVAA